MYAVVSYTAVSPLPAFRRAVCFLLHCPVSHLSRTLSGILPCGARTFLVYKRTRDHLAGSGLLYHTLKHDPPINSLQIEFMGMSVESIPTT